MDATSTQNHVEKVGENIQINKADVNAVIKLLKSKKAPGEDDIRSEMVKAMNMCGVRWLTHIVWWHVGLGKHQSNQGRLVHKSCSTP